MTRGTTPTHTFEFPFDASVLTKIRIMYAQNDAVILEKTEADCSVDGNFVRVKLSQSDTMLFNHNDKVEIQIHALTVDDESLVSHIHTVSVCRLLKDEVLTNENDEGSADEIES